LRQGRRKRVISLKKKKKDAISCEGQHVPPSRKRRKEKKQACPIERKRKKTEGTLTSLSISPKRGMAPKQKTFRREEGS